MVGGHPPRPVRLACSALDSGACCETKRRVCGRVALQWKGEPHCLLRCWPNLVPQIYIDSIWWGQAPDGDQYIAKLLRESFEELFHRYQASRSVCNL